MYFCWLVEMLPNKHQYLKIKRSKLANVVQINPFENLNLMQKLANKSSLLETKSGHI